MNQKSRQYYLNTETDTIYWCDIIVGDHYYCMCKINDFISDFEGDNLCFVLCEDNSKMQTTLMNVDKNVRNYIFQYPYQTISNAIILSDSINTTRMNSWRILAGIHQGLETRQEDEQQSQIVFNITKKYIREQKLKRILNASI